MIPPGKTHSVRLCATFVRTVNVPGQSTARTVVSLARVRDQRLRAPRRHTSPERAHRRGGRGWFHALRNCFISVADRDLMLPASLTKRLVNHSRPQDVIEGYAADWTMQQLRDAAQHIADNLDGFIRAGQPGIGSTRTAA